MARASGGRATVSMHVDFPVFSPRELLKHAHLVILARVVGQGTTLNADSTVVMTEYQLLPVEVLPIVGTQQAPPPATVKVRRAGGVVVTQRLRLETTVDVYRDADIENGSEGIFFLMRSSVPDVYALAGGPYGIYRVENDAVFSLTPDIAARRGEHESMSLEEFVRAFEELKR